MKLQFFAAPVFALVLGLASAPVLARQMGGHDKMPGMEMRMKDKMMSGMSGDDKHQMMVMMDKMAAMPPADRKKAMQKMSNMGKPTGAGKMSGMSAMDKMTSGLSAPDKTQMKMMLDKMMAMPPAERKRAMQKMSGVGKTSAPATKPMPSGGMSSGM